MKTLRVVGLFVCFIGIQANASVVYEGFDYAADAAIWGQGSGDGWDGNWVGAGTDDRGNPTVGTGLSFTNASTVVGGSYVRPQRYGVAQSSRSISAASQATLTADNTTAWFSVLMRVNHSAGGAGGGGYSLNSNGAIVFGDTAFIETANPGSIPPTIGTGGNAMGVNFNGDSNPDNIGMQGVFYANGVVSAATNDVVIIATNTVMVAGKIEWAANGTEDVMSLYNIVDPMEALPEPFTTMSVDLDQTTFNIVAIGQGQTEMFDEIRFGTSAQDVGLGQEYEGMPVLMIDYAAGFVTLSATNLEYAAINNLQSTENLVPSDSWNNLYSVSNVTEAIWTVPASNSATFFRIN